MKTTFCSIFAGAFVLVGCAEWRHQPAPVTPVHVSFDNSEIGGVPQHFATALTGGGGPVLWAVRADSQAPDGGPVLLQESAEDTKYRFPMCIYQDTVARDVAAEVKFKAISGKIDEAGGIVLRYRPGNYYIARANALENNVILFKTVNGQRSHMVEVPASVAPNQWHTLRFQAKADVLTIMLDGKTNMIVNDRTFTNPGKVGLWTKADSVTAFTDFKIEPVAPSGE